MIVKTYTIRFRIKKGQARLYYTRNVAALLLRCLRAIVKRIPYIEDFSLCEMELRNTTKDQW